MSDYTEQGIYVFNDNETMTDTAKLIRIILVIIALCILIPFLGSRLLIFCGGKCGSLKTVDFGNKLKQVSVIDILIAKFDKPKLYGAGPVSSAFAYAEQYKQNNVGAGVAFNGGGKVKEYDMVFSDKLEY